MKPKPSLRVKFRSLKLWSNSLTPFHKRKYFKPDLCKYPAIYFLANVICYFSQKVQRNICRVLWYKIYQCCMTTLIFIPVFFKIFDVLPPFLTPSKVRIFLLTTWCDHFLQRIYQESQKYWYLKSWFLGFYSKKKIECFKIQKWRKM